MNTVALYRYIIGAVFLLCFGVIAVYIKTLESDLYHVVQKVAVMDQTNKIHVNTLMAVNQDLDKVIADNKELEQKVAEQEEMIAQLEQMQYAQ